MIAIDDSTSMSVNQGGRLALEALTVLSTALNQIEVCEKDEQMLPLPILTDLPGKNPVFNLWHPLTRA